MESEKVKEIKEKLQEEIFIANSFGDKLRKVPTKELQNLLTLINELESENAYQKEHIEMWFRKNEEKKNRIAELEKGIEALSFAVKQGFNDCQTKTLKQFAERLKEKATWSFIMCGDHKAGAKTVTLHDIDETLKEYTNENGKV